MREFKYNKKEQVKDKKLFKTLIIYKEKNETIIIKHKAK